MPLDLARIKLDSVVSETCNESSFKEPGNTGATKGMRQCLLSKARGHMS